MSDLITLRQYADRSQGVVAIWSSGSSCRLLRRRNLGCLRHGCASLRDDTGWLLVRSNGYTEGMCARYHLRATADELIEVFSLIKTVWSPGWKPRYNIAPTQAVPVIRQDDHHRSVSLMRWGLVPSWSKDPKSGPPLINARGETVAEKPAFRTAFKRRRCLMPATGFYEWRTEGKAKFPYSIHLPKDEIFAFAGLWESWHDELESCVMVTTEAEGVMTRLHDRQPVILHRDEWAVWLDPEVEADALQNLVRPWDGTLCFDSMDPIINSSKVEGEQYFKTGDDTPDWG